MHLRSIYRDGWLCTAYEPSTAGQPNGLEEVWGDGVLRPCPVVYQQLTTGAGSVGIATGELYNVDEDPHQFENRWDEPAQAALPRRPGGGPLRQPAHRGAQAQGDGAGLTTGTG